MKTLLKAASISNLTDGRYFAAANAEWMGFVLDESREDALSIQLAMEFMGWLSGPRYIGEFGKSTIGFINDAVNTLGLDSIEVTQPIEVAGLSEKVQSILYRIVPEKPFVLIQMQEQISSIKEYVAQFVLDFSAANRAWSDLSDDEKSDLKSFCADHPVLLNFAFDKDNGVEIVDAISPLGIEFRGSEEISTGMQLYTALDPILEALGWEF